MTRFALVTGGSSGIGAAIAKMLAAQGYAVIAAARRFTGAPVALSMGQVVEAKLDVTDADAVRTLIGALPALDVLVCSAGVGTFAPVVSAKPEDLRAMLDVHVVGTMLCAQAALPAMIARKKGHIVAIGSHAAHRAFPECSAYTAAKAGQLGLMRVLAEEARPHDVRVINLLAGATDTPIWDDRPSFDRKKMMRPEDVAKFLLALLDPRIAVEEVTVTPPAGAL